MKLNREKFLKSLRHTEANVRQGLMFDDNNIELSIRLAEVLAVIDSINPYSADAEVLATAEENRITTKDYMETI